MYPLVQNGVLSLVHFMNYLNFCQFSLFVGTKFAVKDSKHFIPISTRLVLQEGDLMVSSYVMNLFPSVPC